MFGGAVDFKGKTALMCEQIFVFQLTFESPPGLADESNFPQFVFSERLPLVGL